MAGMPREVPKPRTAFGRNCGGPSARSRRVLERGRGTVDARAGTYFPDTRSAWCTCFATMPLRSSRSPMVGGGPAIGGRVSDGPSSFRMQRSAVRAAADPER